VNAGRSCQELLARGPPAAGSAPPVDEDRIETVLATVFGVIFLGLAVVVTVETISRKVFNIRCKAPTNWAATRSRSARRSPSAWR
jgi:hypothetical protein